MTKEQRAKRYEKSVQLIPDEVIEITYYFMLNSRDPKEHSEIVMALRASDGKVLKSLTNNDRQSILEVVGILAYDDEWTQPDAEQGHNFRVYRRIDIRHEVIWGIEHIGVDGRNVVLALGFKYKSVAMAYVEKRLRPVGLHTWLDARRHGRDCSESRFYSEVFGRDVVVFIMPMPLFTNEAQLAEPLKLD